MARSGAARAMAGQAARAMGGTDGPSAVEVAAGALRGAALACADGERIGSEEDVLERIGVSRPTLRQAARLLESEELLVVRRGVKGGFFARRPTTDAVARMASV